MSDLAFWIACGIIFIVAVACALFGMLVRDHENPYLFWVGMVPWGMLCVALALVLKARFL